MKNHHIWKDLLYDLKKNRTLAAMLIPPLLILVIFNYIPLYGLQIAFKDYHVLQNMWDADWVGLKYFKRFFEYYDLWKLVKNTVLLNVYDMLLTPVPLIFAVCMNYFPNKKLRNVIQTVAVTPHFISTVVICSLTLKFLGTDGLFNQILGAFGREPENFLLKGELFRHMYVWSGVWQSAGFDSIVYISALAEVPKTQYEAADMDGANLLQKIWYIDLPNILPMFAVNLVFRCGALLNNNYEKLLLLQNNMNLNYSQVISTYTYEVAFGSMVPQYSYATAIGIMISVINMIMLLLVKRLTKRWERMDE